MSNQREKTEYNKKKENNKGEKKKYKEQIRQLGNKQENGRQVHLKPNITVIILNILRLNI